MNFVPQFLKKIFIRDDDSITAEKLYWEIVELSRNPRIYEKFQIADTLDGRFDSLLLHLFLVINRLQEISEDRIADFLLSFFVNDMDRSLRETGVGDPSISRKMRKIGEAYMGRMQSYKDTIDDSENDYKALYHSLHKNIYRNREISEDTIILLTDYVVKYKQVLNHFVPRKPLPKAVLN